MNAHCLTPDSAWTRTEQRLRQVMSDVDALKARAVELSTKFDGLEGDTAQKLMGLTLSISDLQEETRADVEAMQLHFADPKSAARRAAEGRTASAAVSDVAASDVAASDVATSEVSAAAPPAALSPAVKRVPMGARARPATDARAEGRRLRFTSPSDGEMSTRTLMIGCGAWFAGALLLIALSSRGTAPPATHRGVSVAAARALSRRR